MNGFLKFAIGVAVLGIVGLVGLGALGFLIAVPMASYNVVIPAEEVPSPAIATAPEGRGAASAPWAPVAAWNQPARVQVQTGYHDSWAGYVGRSIGLIVFMGMLLIAAVVVSFIRRDKAASPSDETALVHELARRAQDLSQRMEALETILLDRTRATR